ncbi:monocarboxylate transporter 3-like [Glandiceps talaboti]
MPKQSGNSAQHVDDTWKWLIVAGTFFIHFYNAIQTCSGIFFVAFLNYFDEGASVFTLVFTLYAIVLAIGAPMSGFLVSKYGARPIALLGAVLETVAMVSIPFAESVVHLLLTVGIVRGVGMIFVLVPGTSIVATYFQKNFAFANGIATTGGSIGGIVLPILARTLIDFYGWHGSFFIFAGLAANLTVCAVIMKPSEKKNKDISSDQVPDGDTPDVEQDDETPRPRDGLDIFPGTGEEREGLPTECTNEHKNGNSSIIDKNEKSTLVSKLTGFHLLRKYPLLICVNLGAFLFSVAHAINIVFIVVRAVDTGISPLMAAILITIKACGNMIGRLIHGWFVDRRLISPFGLMALAATVQFIATVSFMFSPNFGLMVVCCIFLGLALGVFVPLQTVSSKAIVGMVNLPSAVGLNIAGQVFGTILLPLAGAIYEVSHNSRTPFYVGCAGSAINAILLSITTLCQRLKSKKTKKMNIDT